MYTGPGCTSYNMHGLEWGTCGGKVVRVGKEGRGVLPFFHLKTHLHGPIIKHINYTVDQHVSILQTDFV